MAGMWVDLEGQAPRSDHGVELRYQGLVWNQLVELVFSELCRWLDSETYNRLNSAPGPNASAVLGAQEATRVAKDVLKAMQREWVQDWVIERRKMLLGKGKPGRELRPLLFGDVVRFQRFAASCGGFIMY